MAEEEKKKFCTYCKRQNNKSIDPKLYCQPFDSKHADSIYIPAEDMYNQSYICWLYHFGCYDPDTKTLYDCKIELLMLNNWREIDDFYLSLDFCFCIGGEMFYSSVRNNVMEHNIYQLKTILAEEYIDFLLEL